MNRALALLMGAAAVGVPLVGQLPAARAFRAGGIPVIFKPVSANTVIAVQLYLRGGSPNLTPAQAGIERFIGAASTRGTVKYTREEFAARTAATGAEITTRHTNDYSVIRLRAMGDHWESSWDLFVEAAVHPTFPDSEVSLVRQQLINSLRRREQFPDDVLSRVADSVFFAGHPYGIDPAGSVGALSALIRNDLQAWHRERMTKENLLLVVVGNLSQADLEAKVGRAFGGLPDRGGTALRPPALARGRSGVTIVPRSIPTNYVQGLFSAPSLDHPDYAAMRVAIEILSNRVFEEVRSKRNLAYRARAGLDDRRANTGLLYVSTVQPETTLKVMRHEVERLQTEPITPKRLGETVNVFLTRYFLDQETNSDQAQTLATYELLGGGWQRAATFLQRVRAVTPTDVQRVAREYIQNVSFTILGDSTNIDLARLSSM